MVIQNVGFKVGGICNLVLFVGLLTTSIRAVPVQMSVVETINYPIYIACECDYSLYVDDKYIHHDKTEVKTYDYLETGWNATKRFYPYIREESPKIIAFNGVGNQNAGFLNGFIMDMNNGKDYTKHDEWKCTDFSNTVTKVPPVDWFTFDYDDSGWAMSASFGKNYQNNSFQIYYTERREIHLQAEWLWTSDNTVTNIYCRKKNEKFRTIPVQTSAPHIVQTSAPHIVQPSAPHIVSKTIHATPVQTAAPRPVQTSAPHIVSKTIHATPVQTSAPRPVQTSAPRPVQTSAPHIVQTSAPHIVQTAAPRPVQTAAPRPVQTPAPPPPAPPVLPMLPVPSIVISPNIQIVINNIKYSRKRSYNHINNLLHRIKMYNDDNNIYNQAMYTRNHIENHYNTMLHDIKILLHSYRSQYKYNSHYYPKYTKRFIVSMNQLNKSIKNIEHSLQFIKGNHKYILLRILHRLKMEYQNDTLRLLYILNNDFK